MAADGAVQSAREDDGDAIYEAFFPTVAEGRARADKQLRGREVAAGAASDMEVYEAVFGRGTWAGED